MGFLKGKTSIIIYQKYGNMKHKAQPMGACSQSVACVGQSAKERSEDKFKYRNRNFWCRGYYVDTAGKDSKKIQKYIQD